MPNGKREHNSPILFEGKVEALEDKASRASQ